MKKIVVIAAWYCMAIIPSASCFAQSSTDLPKVITPPADAASLGKYGDVPVSMSVGLPNISVPVYEIKTPRLNVPVSLSYYASGIKVDDLSGWTGLGWTLNAGGIITRAVRGKDDVVGYAHYNNNLPLGDTMTSANWQYEDQVTLGITDTEPDYFFYNFLGHTGKFIFGEDGRPIIVHYQEPLSIQYSLAGTSFTILDGKGNEYLFNDKESTQSFSTSIDDYPNHGMTYISGWYLSRIVSFDKSDTISFHYFTDATVFQTFNNYSEGLGPTYSCSDNEGSTTNGPVSNGVSHDGLDVITSESFLYSTPIRLQEIDYRNGKVVFFSSGSRSDYDGTKLDSLTVYYLDASSGSYHAQQTSRFSYDYYVSNFGNPTSTGYRLRLNSIGTTGSQNEDGGKYSFQYDSTMLPLVGSKGKDLFNYYNGANSNPTLVPAQTVNYGGQLYQIGAANRQTSTNFIQAGVLKHIYYPTGGRTDFTYEPNSFSENQYNTHSVQIEAAARGIPRGGIQMGIYGQADTVLYTAGNSTQTTVAIFVASYNYSDVQTRPFVSLIDLTANQTLYLNGAADPNNGLSITLPFNPVIGHLYQLIARAYDDNHVYSSVIINQVVTDTTLATVLGGGLRLKQITNYDYTSKFAGSELYKYGANECGYGYLPSPYFLFNVFTQNSSTIFGCSDQGSGSCAQVTYGRTYFNAYNTYDVFNLSSSPLSYPEVAKYIIDSLGNTAGKTVYDYTVYQTGVLPVIANSFNGGIQITNSGYEGGQLISQTDFLYQGGRYAPVKKLINAYNNISQRSGRGVKIDYVSAPTGCWATGPLGVQYYAFDYPIYSGSVLPASQVSYEYDQQDTTKYVATTRQFFYDNNDHLQPTRMTSDRSDGTSTLTINRYPAEIDSLINLTADQTAVIDTLQSRHNITTLLQTQMFRGSDAVSLVRFDYKIWPGSLVLPADVQEQVSGYPIETRLQYYNFDNNGNVLQVAKNSDVNHAYLWDYNKANPIAEVVNAAQSDIAYTSFEADGSGNWGIPSGLRDPGSITGLSCYNLANGSCTRSGLTGAATYIVSYWSKSHSGYAVSGTINTVQGKTIGGWTYFEHTVTGVSTLSVSGGDDIDELRLYPAHAQMTTYTYQPLVGQTSKCDVDNRVTYYNYDGLGRLKFVKDQDGNMLKTIDYHYQGRN